MKIYKMILVIALLSFPASLTWADSEPPLDPYVTAAAGGKFYFKMVPDATYDREKGSGACYQVREGELDKFLWKTSGWYSPQVFLSDSGEYLARMGNWPRGQEPDAQDVAVAFYKNGSLIKSYSTTDLIKDPLVVKKTISHYSWTAAEPEFKSAENQLIVTTTDGNEYTFDMVTGEILSERKTEATPMNQLENDPCKK